MSLVFCVLTKHIFGFNIKNMDIYMFHVYWTYIHIQHASNCLNIMFLYLDEFWTKRFSISKILVLENTEFGFGKFSKSQKWFKMFEICVDIFNTSFYFKV